MQPFPGTVPQAQQGKAEHLCLALRDFSSSDLSKTRKSQTGQNYERKRRCNNIYLLKELRQVFRFVFISADARSVFFF